MSGGRDGRVSTGAKDQAMEMCEEMGMNDGDQDRMRMNDGPVRGILERTEDVR